MKYPRYIVVICYYYEDSGCKSDFKGWFPLGVNCRRGAKNFLFLYLPALSSGRSLVCPALEKIKLVRSFVRMTISSEVAVHQISFEHRVVNIG